MASIAEEGDRLFSDATNRLVEVAANALNIRGNEAPPAQSAFFRRVDEMGVSAAIGVTVVKSAGDSVKATLAPIDAIYRQDPYAFGEASGGLMITAMMTRGGRLVEGRIATNSAGAPRITLQQRTANHNAHLDDIAGQLREQGYTVKGNGARFYDSTGQNYTHTDLFAIRPNGEPIIIEMKTGGAVNTARQNQIYPQILTGDALPSRPVARMLGIKPNVPLNQQGYTNGIPIYQVKALGL
jgi:hypothetical protein